MFYICSKLLCLLCDRAHVVCQGRVTKAESWSPTHCPPAELQVCGGEPSRQTQDPQVPSSGRTQTFSMTQDSHFICLCSKGIIILSLSWFSSHLVSSDSNLFVQVPFFTLCPYSTIGYQSQLGHRCVNTVHLIKS